MIREPYIVVMTSPGRWMLAVPMDKPAPPVPDSPVPVYETIWSYTYRSAEDAVRVAETMRRRVAR